MRIEKRRCEYKRNPREKDRPVCAEGIQSRSEDLSLELVIQKGKQNNPRSKLESR